MTTQFPQPLHPKPDAYVLDMRIRVLGPLEVEIGGEIAKLGGPKQRALFALLTLRIPHVAPVDELIFDLWGDDATSGARSTLQTYVSSLRQTLGEVVVYERGGYRLDVSGVGGPGGVDLIWFDPETYEELHRRVRIHDGALSSAIRRGSIVATASADGFARLWDIDRREMVHEIDTGAEVNGVALINDQHVAVVFQDGTLRVHTLDPVELRRILLESLVRDFTPEECSRFGFDDQCPTRQDLAARS